MNKANEQASKHMWLCYDLQEIWENRSILDLKLNLLLNLKRSKARPSSWDRRHHVYFCLENCLGTCNNRPAKAAMPLKIIATVTCMHRLDVELRAASMLTRNGSTTRRIFDPKVR